MVCSHQEVVCVAVGLEMICLDLEIVCLDMEVVYRHLQVTTDISNSSRNIIGSVIGILMSSNLQYRHLCLHLIRHI
jgi:hypothetical protein